MRFLASIVVAVLLTACSTPTAVRAPTDDDPDHHEHLSYAAASDRPWTSDSSAKWLFPLQLVPNAASNTLLLALTPVRMIYDPDPHTGGNLWPLMVVLSPIVGPVFGAKDAWHGYGFWQPAALSQDRKY